MQTLNQCSTLILLNIYATPQNLIKRAIYMRSFFLNFYSISWTTWENVTVFKYWWRCLYVYIYLVIFVFRVHSPLPSLINGGFNIKQQLLNWRVTITIFCIYCQPVIVKVSSSFCRKMFWWTMSASKFYLIWNTPMCLLHTKMRLGLWLEKYISSLNRFYTSCKYTLHFSSVDNVS